MQIIFIWINHLTQEPAGFASRRGLATIHYYTLPGQKYLNGNYLYSYIQAFWHIITCCRCSRMDVFIDIERFVKFNKIGRFLKLHYYGDVELIKYIMSELNI